MGGSLGGLTAALVLRDIGCEVQVYEKSRTPLEGRGAGIVLHPSTVRYLTENKVLNLEEVSASARWFRYLDKDGNVIHQEPCRYRFTSYYTLYQGLLRAFGEKHYNLGRPVIGFRQGERCVTVDVDGEGQRECDLLVCADGIHSTARAILFPQVTQQYAGYVGWRGTVGEGRLHRAVFSLLDEAITYFVMPHGHILAYPIPGLKTSSRSERRLTNFVWYRNVPEGDPLQNLMRGRSGRRYPVSLPPGEVRERYVAELRTAAISQLPPPLAEMVRATEEPFVQAVFDIEVPRMSVGRICLIGDAAFALRPHAAAGTAKAAEDAWRLGKALRDSGHDVGLALERWEPAQLALGRQVLERTREAGNRSQFDGTWKPGDPLPFGLYQTGDSAMA
jgi:2,6-dihydroxypyridine 3-monooxygenase